MSTQSSGTPTLQKHAGPPLWLLAILYTVLFNAGLYPVTMLAGKPYWPGPWEPANVVVPYFQTHHTAVLTCLFLQFGAIICFGLFSAVAVSQLQFLGVRSAGPWIALFGDRFRRSRRRLYWLDDDSPRSRRATGCPARLFPSPQCFRRGGILAAGGSVHGRPLGLCRFCKAAAKVDSHTRTDPGCCRRVELVSSHQPRTAVSNPPGPISRFHLAYCCRLRAAADSPVSASSALS